MESKLLTLLQQQEDQSGLERKQKQPDFMMTKANILEYMHREDPVLLIKDMIWQI